MCVPFTHKWDYKLLDKPIKVYSSHWAMNNSAPDYTKYIYIGVCSKCGSIKKKTIKT